MMMKLNDSETESLRDAHRRLISAQLDLKRAQLDMETIRVEMLVRKDAWGCEFNEDYTEIVKPPPRGER
jgi:hypothetical protein